MAEKKEYLPNKENGFRISNDLGQARVCIFESGGEKFAIDILRVEHFVNNFIITKIPTLGMPEHIKKSFIGITDYHNKKLAVFDFAHMQGDTNFEEKIQFLADREIDHINFKKKAEEYGKAKIQALRDGTPLPPKPNLQIDHTKCALGQGLIKTRGECGRHEEVLQLLDSFDAQHDPFHDQARIVMESNDPDEIQMALNSIDFYFENIKPLFQALRDKVEYAKYHSRYMIVRINPENDKDLIVLKIDSIYHAEWIKLPEVMDNELVRGEISTEDDGGILMFKLSDYINPELLKSKTEKSLSDTLRQSDDVDQAA